MCLIPLLLVDLSPLNTILRGFWIFVDHHDPDDPESREHGCRAGCRQVVRMTGCLHPWYVQIWQLFDRLNSSHPVLSCTDMYCIEKVWKSFCLTNHLLGLQLRIACTFELDPSVSRALDRYNMIQLARKEVGVWWHASSLCLFWSISLLCLLDILDILFWIIMRLLSWEFCGCKWLQRVHERWRYFVHRAGSTVASTISARPALHGRGGQLATGHQDDWKWSLTYTKLYKHI